MRQEVAMQDPERANNEPTTIAPATATDDNELRFRMIIRCARSSVRKRSSLNVASSAPDIEEGRRAGTTNALTPPRLCLRGRIAATSPAYRSCG